MGNLHDVKLYDGNVIGHYTEGCKTLLSGLVNKKRK